MFLCTRCSSGQSMNSVKALTVVPYQTAWSSYTGLWWVGFTTSIALGAVPHPVPAQTYVFHLPTIDSRLAPGLTPRTSWLDHFIWLFPFFVFTFLHYSFFFGSMQQIKLAVCQLLGTQKYSLSCISYPPRPVLTVPNVTSPLITVSMSIVPGWFVAWWHLCTVWKFTY